MVHTDKRPLVILDSAPLRRLAAPGAEYDARVVYSREALFAALEAAHPSTVVLLDPYVERLAGGPSPLVREVIWRCPSLPVVAALQLRPERVHDVRTLLDWGVSEVLDLELEPTPRGVLARLRAAHARPLKRRLEDVLSRYVSHTAHDILRAAAEVAVDGGAAPQLAARFGVEPRTLAGWCTREALPAPRRLQAWMRVLLGAALLEEPARSVANVARGAGYANDHALRRALRDLAGADPAALPRDQAFARASERFNDELLSLRERARERRKARARPL